MTEPNSERLRQANGLLKEKVLRRLPAQDRIATAIDTLVLSRRDETEKLENCFYRPVVAVVLQGAKRAVIGNEEHRYGAFHCMVSAIDTPSVNHITQASADAPFLAMSISLDRYLTTKLIGELPETPEPIGRSVRGVVVADVTIDLLDAFSRLVDLLDTPDRVPVLAPMIIREIHYLLLIGAHGECLRQFATQGTQSHQIARAITWIRENYREPLVIEDLAKRVAMAPSTFHRHFRDVTSMSPLQFQKRLRLYEAQRLMLTEKTDASVAALEVGYESATQFNREYKRLFGEPPFRDVNRLRQMLIPVRPFSEGAPQGA